MTGSSLSIHRVCCCCCFIMSSKTWQSFEAQMLAGLPHTSWVRGSISISVFCLHSLLCPVFQRFPPLSKGMLCIQNSISVVSKCVCVWLWMCPMMVWHHVHGVPCLIPRVPFDRLQVFKIIRTKRWMDWWKISGLWWNMDLRLGEVKWGNTHIHRSNLNTYCHWRGSYSGQQSSSRAIRWILVQRTCQKVRPTRMGWHCDMWVTAAHFITGWDSTPWPLVKEALKALALMSHC